MSEKVAIQLETLTRLADGFRESRGISNNLTTEQMITLAQEPIKPEQEKTVDITENGSTEIMADEGHVLTKVTANVNVAASAENKLAQRVDGTLTEIIAEDLAGITTINRYAFYYCDNLTSVTIPDSVTSIGSSAFYQCEELINLTIPNTVTVIGPQAFAYCRKLPSIIIPNSVVELGPSAFQSCDRATTIIISNGLRSLTQSAFHGCQSVTNIIVPEGVVELGNYVFLSCTALTEIALPNSLLYIGVQAFNGCPSLKNLTIPASVISIGSQAIITGTTDDTGTVTFLGTTPPTISSNTFNVNYLNKIIVPAGSGEAYRTATNWANFADYIEEASV